MTLSSNRTTANSPPGSLSASLRAVEQSLKQLGGDRRAKRIAQLRKFQSDPSIRVVVFGEFSRGKSTLINALLERVLLPAKLVPTTGHITRVVYGDTEEIRIKESSGQVKRFGYGRLDEFVLLDNSGTARQGVEVIEVAANHPFLKSGLRIIDTPGVGERQAQTRRAQFEIAFADLVLFVLDATQILGHAEQERSDWIAQRLQKPVVLIVNKMDLVIEEYEKDEVRTRVDRWCRANLPNDLGQYWFEVNALGSLKRAIGRPAEISDRDQTSELRLFLHSLQGERRRRVQLRARRGQLLAEMSELGDENSPILDRIRNNRDQVAAERVVKYGDLDRTLKQLTSQGPSHRAVLQQFAARTLKDAQTGLLENLERCKLAEELDAAIETQFKDHLFDAVRQIEKKAIEQLCTIVGPELPHPEPLTIREQIIINFQIKAAEVDVLATSFKDETAGSFGKKVASSVAAGIIGQMLIPIPGVGIGIGVALFNYLFSKSPEQQKSEALAQLLPEIRQLWIDTTIKIPEMAASQFDERLNEYVRQLSAQIEEARHLADFSSLEFHQRLALAYAITRCRTYLQTNPTRPLNDAAH